MANLPETSLKSLAEDFDDFPEFVSTNLPEILVNETELASKRLKLLNFDVKDLAAIKEHSEIVRTMFEAGLFELTIANLEYVYQAILGERNLEPLRERNFTTIRSKSNATLMERVERDFDRYVRDILLGLQGNSKEDAPAIMAVVCHDGLDQDDLQEFLERQTTLLPTLEDVPKRLHAMLFKINAIEPTWANCLGFMEGDGFDQDSLVGYLDRDDVRGAILQYPIPSDSDSLKLRRFLIEADSLSDGAYREYAHALPNSFKKPPEGLEPAKLRILIDEGRIMFSKDSLDAFADNRDLQVLFVTKNIARYLENPDNFALDDDSREELLRSELDNEAKLGLIELMDLETLVGLPERAALIGPLLRKADAQVSNINFGIAQSLIKNSTPETTQIAILNKYHTLMTDDEVRHLLSNLQEPFSEIKTGYNIPRLENTPENKDLVRWLDSRDIISSWSDGGFFTNDIRVNLYRS